MITTGFNLSLKLKIEILVNIEFHRRMVLRLIHPNCSLTKMFSRSKRTTQNQWEVEFQFELSLEIVCVMSSVIMDLKMNQR
eukprot:jgi/Psemu1/312947/fgenesh1_kg.1062_\